MNILTGEVGHTVGRPVTALITAAAASLALIGCSAENKPDFAAFCVATSPGNVGAMTVEQTIQNTTLRLGVSKAGYRGFKFRPQKDMLGPEVVTKDSDENKIVTREKFDGTVVDAIKLKLIEKRKTDPEKWRSVRTLDADEIVFCYRMKNAESYNDGGEIFAFEAPTDPPPAFDTQARNDISGGPKNFRSLLRQYPKGVFVLNPAFTEVERVVLP